VQISRPIVQFHLSLIQEDHEDHIVVIAADRGLNSKINLKMILDAGYGYIVGKINASIKRGGQS
jgi:hypothetical protein